MENVTDNWDEFIHFFTQSHNKSTNNNGYTPEELHVPWFLWPFWAVWMLLATIVEMVGRFVAMVLGLVLILVGVLISMTIIGAIIGIPLALIGFLLLLRGIF